VGAPDPTGEQIEETIEGLLRERDAGKTICPSDAARALAGEGDFRPLMDPVRDRAAAMADDGRLEVTQGGEVVDIASARGPIRLRLPPR
jgi:Protein of unknown function (DUF3253)